MSELDIVERLRIGLQIDNGNQVIGRPPTHLHGPLLDEAADEIERLRAGGLHFKLTPRMLNAGEHVLRAELGCDARRYLTLRKATRDIYLAMEAAKETVPEPTLPPHWAEYMIRDLLGWKQPC